jgi:lactate dehydrogenase-like 2-hydroxyacid dehydrogenase
MRSATPHTILVTRRLPDAVEERLSRDYTLVRPKDSTAPAFLACFANARDVAGILCTPADYLSSELIAAFPKSIKIIATYSVGFNHIDVTAAGARGIAITNTPGVLTDATADLAMLLLLGAARRASEGDSLVRSGKWLGWEPTQLLGMDVSGKSLGILGMGRIGTAVARRAAAFDMRIHCLGRASKDIHQRLEWHHHEKEDTFWPNCQFLSIHLPGGSATQGFLNAQRIAALPHGAVVVNTARGEIVDDDALIKALSDGHVAAAGLDVFAGEPHFRKEYAALPNTLLLPHLGSATVETRTAMGFKALDNLDAFFGGLLPPDLVD